MRSENQNVSSRREFILLRPPAAHQPSDSPAKVADRPLAHSRRASSLAHFSHRAMACDFQIFLPLGRYPQGAEIAMRAFGEIDRLEDIFSIFRPESELMALNRTAATRYVPVSPELFEVAEMALDLAQATHGAFDPTSTPLSRVWGFMSGTPCLPTPAQIAEARQRVGYLHVAMRHHDNAIHYLRPHIELNVNGIGKGYALQQTAQLLLRSGISDFVIHGGQSSVVAHGNDPGNPPGQSGWRIGLSHPTVPENRLLEFNLIDQSLGTSGSGRQAFFVHGRRFGHVLDPRTGWPADHVVSTTVVHNNAAICDALSTGCFVMADHEVNEFCNLRTEVAVIRVSLSDSGTPIVKSWNFSG